MKGTEGGRNNILLVFKGERYAALVQYQRRGVTRTFVDTAPPPRTKYPSAIGTTIYCFALCGKKCYIHQTSEEA